MIEGVQPLSVTVSLLDLLSCSTTRQSGAVNPELWILNLPSRPARAPAAEVVELALMKPVAAPEPTTVNWPPFRDAVLTASGPTLVPAAVAAFMAAGPASRVRAAIGTMAARSMRARFMTFPSDQADRVGTRSASGLESGGR